MSSPSGFWRAGVLARALSAAVTVGAGAGGPRPCRPGRVHLRSGAESSLTDHAGPLARGVGHLVCEAEPRLLHPLIDLGTGLLEPGLETRVGPHLVVDTRGERSEVLAFR